MTTDNPYEPPNADLGSPSPNRPLGVWLITFFLGISVLGNIFQEILLQKGLWIYNRLPESTLALYRHSTFEWVELIIFWIVVADLAVSLFCLRAESFTLCIVIMAWIVIGIGRRLLMIESLFGFNVMLELAPLLFYGFVTLYVNRLKFREILR